MGNGSRAAVHGIGRVGLKLTSRKTLCLNIVQHAPEITKTLLVVLFYVVIALSWCLSRTSLLFPNLVCLLVKVMRVVVSSIFQH
jgi:hypothetical protein